MQNIISERCCKQIICTIDSYRNKFLNTDGIPDMAFRAAQEQLPGERSFIVCADEINKQERVHRQIENKQLELEHGIVPEQHGLRSPC